MSIVMHLFYMGSGGSAREFVREMEESGLAERIRREAGNEGYEYFFAAADEETVLLIDRWRDQAALDAHHASPMMGEISRLREKYDLHMRAERLEPAADERGMEFIRK